MENPSRNLGRRPTLGLQRRHDSPQHQQISTYHIKLHSRPLLFLRARLLSMATTEVEPEAKPEPKEIEEISETLLKCKGRHLPDMLRHRQRQLY
ncbi:hypothetical protein C1H46_018088 [Malus baccata]|uniref:Uncharacterized protein n=1 Tax=Malus baccata TaxID=106549 RepID=A0A540MCL1_MALBA|nr:hypothetical protein C1H46_018088 [Malus baccata]